MRRPETASYLGMFKKPMDIAKAEGICDRYFADVVVSFGIRAVLPPEVSTTLANFVGKWVISTLPLMNVISQAMDTFHIDQCSPVFSSRKFDGYHFTLVNPSTLCVGGEQILCQNRCSCSLSASSKRTGKAGRKKWRIICSKCSFQTSYFWPEDASVKGREKDGIFMVPGVSYLRTRFPIPVKALEWRKKKSPVKALEGRKKKSPDIRPPPASPSPSPSPLASAPASTLPSPHLMLGSTLPREVQTTADRVPAGLLPLPPSDSSPGALPTAPTLVGRTGSIRLLPPRATGQQVESSDKPPGPASVPKKKDADRRDTTSRKNVSRRASAGPKTLRATQPDTSSEELSGPVSMGPMMPRLTHGSSKRHRKDSSTTQPPPDLGEGSSKSVKKKKSRICG